MDAIKQIKQAKKIVLLEPQYERKYIPLGLAKIASMAKDKGIAVDFQREYQPVGEDLVCITSLFTYDSGKVLNAIQQVRQPQLFSSGTDIILGGVYATLMPKHIKERFPDINIYSGYSKELDKYPPDYSIDWQVEDPWDTFSFVFTTRGCPNKCGYCAVWRIEPDMWINKKWESHIDLAKPNIMISDNNLSAQPLAHIKAICKFTNWYKKKITFDNGFDCKYITNELAKLLGTVRFYPHGMRLAFDRIQEDGIFQTAINRLKDNGVTKGSLMAYCLFNFMDTPQEANYRMTECVKLGIRPYPQQYTPLNYTNRDKKYIGKYWTKNLLRCFRFFWLMAGHYTKMTFEEFVKSQDKYSLNQEDWKAWYSTK